MTVVTTLKTESGLAAMLDRQRTAFLRDGPPSLAQRRSDLMKFKDAVLAHREDFVTAINATSATGRARKLRFSRWRQS